MHTEKCNHTGKALAPGGVPDAWLNLLAEVTGAVPLVVFALVVVAVYGATWLSNHKPIGLEVVGLDQSTESE